jgi:signal peptidase I
MGINFPLFLVLTTAFTGLVWLAEVFYFRPKRESSAEGKREQDAEELLKKPALIEYSISFFPVLLIVLLLRSFLAEPFQIPTGSMIPTLQVGDFIVVSKFSYGLRLPVIGTKIFEVDQPKNGEVMVFIPPHEDEYFIKRVVGIPGDTVRYENKTLYINDVEQKREFVARIPPNRPNRIVYKETLGEVSHLIHNNPFSGDGAQEWTVPEGHYFMMGDNRDQSSDSRVWGLAAEENIVGKAVAIWLHKEPGLSMPGLSRNGLIR